MRKPLAMLLLSATLLGGCLVGVPGHLYPVHGPLSTQTPAPVYKVSMSGVLKSGTMTATLQGGEVFSGSWSAIAQDDPSANSMAADWDSVYGSGFFVAHVLGKPVFARAALTAPNGAVLNVQLYDPKPGNVSAVVGVARDASGNVYKLTF